MGRLQVRRIGLSLGLLVCSGAIAGAPAPSPQPAPKLGPGTLPPVTAILSGSRVYPLTTVASTNHAGWTESTAVVNFPQEVKLEWKVDRGGVALVEGRPAWEPSSPWQELGKWGRGTDRPSRGATTLSLAEPTALRVRVRAARFPRSGISRVKIAYSRKTLAALRGPGTPRARSVLFAEGYDPFNTQDFNDPSWHSDPAFTDLVEEGRSRHQLDAWILDWGDAAAPLEQQAEDFTEIARQLRERNGGRRNTVAVGVSMGAISVRYALATAADAKDDLGVCRYVSVNGPHRGAWINPKLREFLLKRAGNNKSGDENPIVRGLDSPAAQALLIGGKRHEAFYADLRSRGQNGYHPGIPRVAFSNGSLVREGNELADLVEGKREVVHRVSVRPLWLPVWLTVHRTRSEFKYGAFPGELLPSSLRAPYRDHARFLGVLRVDFRARWEDIPTFIPTHSALDFPETLSGETERYRYSQWRQSAFPVLYVSPSRNLPHDRADVAWVNPRTGKGVPSGEKAILHEIAQAYR